MTLVYCTTAGSVSKTKTKKLMKIIKNNNNVYLLELHLHVWDKLSSVCVAGWGGVGRDSQHLLSDEKLKEKNVPSVLSCS